MKKIKLEIEISEPLYNTLEKISQQLGIGVQELLKQSLQQDLTNAEIWIERTYSLQA